MNKFNLTFSGEIVPGHDVETVKLRFANMFAIDDPVRLERFFSGDTIILRRNLERKDAAQYYHELQLIGVVAALVKVTTRDIADSIVNGPAPPKHIIEDRTTAFVRSASRRAASPRPRDATDKRQEVGNAATASHSEMESEPAPTAVDAVQGPDIWAQDNVDIAAQIKARKLEVQRLAAEKLAQEQAELARQQREIAEEYAREQAAAAERERLAEEERAEQEAERERRAAEEEAKQKAVLAEARRKAAEEAARQEAERARQARLDAEVAARKKSEKAAARRKAAEEAAQRKARRNQEKAERARQKAEEVARRKAALEEKKRLAAEETARRKAELEEQKRLAVEAEARRKAELDQQKRLAAEEEARRKAELEEQKRRELEEEARRARLEAEEDARLLAELEAIKHREAEEAARLQAELEEKARQAAARTAQIKAEAEQLLAEAQRNSAERRRIAAEKLAAREKLQEEKTHVESRRQVAEHPAQAAALKPAKTRLKSSLGDSLRKQGQAAQESAPNPRKRQPGEPNLYKLRPFRNTDEVRTRAARARRHMRRAYALGVVALTGLFLVGGSFLQLTIQPPITGAQAIAINSNFEPLLLAGNSLLFHDRAGVSTTTLPLAELGLSALDAPLAFDTEDVLLAQGRLIADRAQRTESDNMQLLRCDFSQSRCQPLASSLLDSDIEAFVINPLDGSLLLADRATGELLKLNRDGLITARAAVTIPERAVLRLHGGLLLMNSADGPAISVFRYEDDAFGKQLDEILLLPPAGHVSEHSRVGDFVWSGGSWWANLSDVQSGVSSLYRFDEEWNYLDEVALPVNTHQLQLVNWGRKTLANHPQQASIERFNPAGAAEVPFVSSQLGELIADTQASTRLANASWRGGLLLCALAAVLGFGLGYLQNLRRLVYNARREQGAEPIDDYAASLLWIDPVPNRPQQLQHRGILYGLFAVGAVLLAIGFSVSAWQLAALLLALSGPAIALLLLSRQPTGHIGILDNRLLLVDHSGMYHLAGGSRLHYHGPFLSIDDIVVFAGSRMLPAFSASQVQQFVRPIAVGGIKVDRKTLAVKLLQSRHPLALGAVAILAGVAAAALTLCLHNIL